MARSGKVRAAATALWVGLLLGSTSARLRAQDPPPEPPPLPQTPLIGVTFPTTGGPEPGRATVSGGNKLAVNARVDITGVGLNEGQNLTIYYFLDRAFTYYDPEGFAHPPNEVYGAVRQIAAERVNPVPYLGIGWYEATVVPMDPWYGNASVEDIEYGDNQLSHDLAPQWAVACRTTYTLRIKVYWQYQGGPHNYSVYDQTWSITGESDGCWPGNWGAIPPQPPGP